MEIDQVFQSVLGYGSFQRKLVWTVGLLNIFQAFQNLHNVYIGAEPKFLCVRGKNELTGCPADNSRCDSVQFYGKDFTSIVSEWNLVCDESYKAQFVQSAFMIGILCGSLMAGIVADKFGRRHLTYGALIWMGIFTLCGAWTDSYTSYVVIRGLVGFGGGTMGIVSFVLITELINQPDRSFVGMAYPTIFAVGIAIYSTMAYFVRDWKHLTALTALPAIVGVYLFRILPESPRWLYGMGQKEASESVLAKIALKNGGSPLKEPIILQDLDTNASTTKVSGDQLSIIGILLHPILRGWTLISAFTWFVCCAVYYGLTFGAGSLGSNMYISISLSGLVEIPAYFLTWYLMDRIGRRLTYSCSMLFGGVMCLGILVLPEGFPNMKIAVALLGKMGISVSFCVNWVYTAEFYPTTIRNKGLSISNMSARFGGVLSPMILAIGSFHTGFDFLVFGILSLLSGMIALKLPETANKPLPETLSDLHILLT